MYSQKQMRDYKTMGELDDAEVLGNHGNTHKVKWTFLREAGKASWWNKHLNEGCRDINHVNRGRSNEGKETRVQRHSTRSKTSEQIQSSGWVDHKARNVEKCRMARNSAVQLSTSGNKSFLQGLWQD